MEMFIFAQAAVTHLNPETIAVTTIYAIVGAILLMAAYKVFDLINPLDFDKEIANNNISLSIMVAGFFVSMAIIIASAIFG
jgi:uncharacterized membrane protein YjfL (UPF0719 family)